LSSAGVSFHDEVASTFPGVVEPEPQVELAGGIVPQHPEAQRKVLRFRLRQGAVEQKLPEPVAAMTRFYVQLREEEMIRARLDLVKPGDAAGRLQNPGLLGAEFLAKAV
jgi:hypothetical protein